MKLRWPLFAAGIICAALACYGRPGVGAHVDRLVRAEGASELRLADAAPFAWDRVVLFAPYTPRAAVCATLGIAAAACDEAIPFESVSDAEMSLAFLLGPRLVRYERHRRRHGDFTSAPLGRPIAREDAVFRIVADDIGSGGARWIRLVRRAPDRGG